jgi:hypothetical protein
MIYRGPGLLAVVLFVSKLDRPHRKTEKKRQLADGREGEGVEEEPNQPTSRKPGPL